MPVHLDIFAAEDRIDLEVRRGRVKDWGPWRNKKMVDTGSRRTYSLSASGDTLVFCWFMSQTAQVHDRRPPCRDSLNLWPKDVVCRGSVNISKSKKVGYKTFRFLATHDNDYLEVLWSRNVTTTPVTSPSDGVRFPNVRNLLRHRHVTGKSRTRAFGPVEADDRYLSCSWRRLISWRQNCPPYFFNYLPLPTSP